MSNTPDCTIQVLVKDEKPKLAGCGGRNGFGSGFGTGCGRSLIPENVAFNTTVVQPTVAVATPAFGVGIGIPAFGAGFGVPFGAGFGVGAGFGCGGFGLDPFGFGLF